MMRLARRALGALGGAGLPPPTPTLGAGLEGSMEPMGALMQRRWATKKAAGSTQNGRDSRAKFLGFKMYGSELAEPGNIILRQRGTKWHAGANVGMGRDHTLFALVRGHIMTLHMPGRRAHARKYIYINPLAEEEGEGEGEAEQGEEGGEGEGLGRRRAGAGAAAARG